MRLLRSERFGLVLDFLILGAVIISDEVTRSAWWAFLGALVLVMIVRGLGEKIRQRVAVGSFLSLLIFGGGLARGWWGERSAPLWVALQLAPCFLALGYSLPTSVRSVGFRLGIQFVVLALACLAQPELSTGLILLSWFFGLPLVLMILFSESRGVDPGIRVFMGVWGKMILILVVMAALIFPFLPRFDTSRLYGNTVGYTESVSTEGRTLSDAKPQTDWWVMGEEGLDRVRLLRARVLERWIGTRLEAGIYQPEVLRAQAAPKIAAVSEPTAVSETETLTLVAARNWLARSLPIPYGFAPVDLPRSQQYEYSNESGAKRFQLADAPAFKDRPTRKDLEVPEALKTARLVALARLVRSPVEMTQYFQSQGFSGTLNSDAKNLESFLFQTRQGNCQYFSLASLVLLRLSGVPTRMIAGYRVTRPAMAGVISIRTQDAHAWVEVWNDKNEVWIPYDSTPMQMQDLSWAKRISLYFRDLSDAAFALWNKYVLGFDQEQLWAGARAIRDPALALLASALILFLGIRKWRKRRGRSDQALHRRLLRRYEKAVESKGEGSWSRRWKQTYESLRFGRPDHSTLQRYKLLRLKRLIDRAL